MGQEAQLSQRDCAMLCVIEYFVKPLRVIRNNTLEWGVCNSLLVFLWSASSGKLDVQRTATAIGRRNFAVSGPETWNSLPAELHLSTLSSASFARRLKTHFFVSTE